MPLLFDYDATRAFIEQVVVHYERSAPTVERWANDLYIRLGEREPVQVDEIVELQNLLNEDGWMPPNFAANRIYHLKSRLGQDTTGEVGF